MQSFLIVSLLILVCGLLFLVLKWPQGKHITFSGHAAAYRHTIIYYNLLFTLVLPLLAFFFYGWFIPTFQLPILFGILLGVSLLFQYIVTLTPEIGGWKTTYHRVLSFISAALLPLLLVMILVSEKVDSGSKLIAGVSIVVMLIIIGIVTRNRGKQRDLLLLQSIYYAAFFTTIVSVTYW
jgi:hypothetical protein